MRSLMPCLACHNWRGRMQPQSTCRRIRQQNNLARHIQTTNHFMRSQSQSTMTRWPVVSWHSLMSWRLSPLLWTLRQSRNTKAMMPDCSSCSKPIDVTMKWPSAMMSPQRSHALVLTSTLCQWCVFRTLWWTQSLDSVTWCLAIVDRLGCVTPSPCGFATPRSKDQSTSVVTLVRLARSAKTIPAVKQSCLQEKLASIHGKKLLSI